MWLLQSFIANHTRGLCLNNIVMWRRKCNDNLSFIAAVCNKIMTFLGSCTHPSSLSMHQQGNADNQRETHTHSIVPDSDRDAFKFENLDAFYMSTISNSHSILTFNFWIFPREAALDSVPSWYRCTGRERAWKGKKVAAGGNQEKMLHAIFPE